MPYKEKEIKKKYFKIGEVAELLDIENTSEIRFWLEEFSFMVSRNSKGDRRFRRGDIKKVAILKFLLDVEGYTLKGASKNFYKYECDDMFNVKRVIL